MNLGDFVTEYDDSLSGDSYIDPLGVLVIWSSFGGQIFKGRVNSVSNDVRAYTINLLNHAIIRSIVDDDSVALPGRLENAIGDKKSLGFRQACLIYLENLITYSLVSAESQSDVDSSGILGGSKARRDLADGSDPTLILSNDSSAFLLVRQLGLGVSGRYKTPFKQLELFDDRYNYRHKAIADERWGEARKILDHRTDLGQLYEQCRTHLVELIRSGQAKPREHLSEVPPSLRETCCRALGTPQRVGAATKDVWLVLTDLNQGAAGALYQAMMREEGVSLPKPELFRRAETLCDSGQNRQLLHHVQTLEPFLAEVDLLFTLCCTKRSPSLASVEEQWQALGRKPGRLPGLTQAIEEESGIRDTLTGTARHRFNRLMSVGQQPTVSEQVRGLLDYHKSVMSDRGQLPWVSCSTEGHLNLQVRQMSEPSREKRPIGHWVNNYYIPQFRNLVSGLQGEGA